MLTLVHSQQDVRDMPIIMYYIILSTISMKTILYTTEHSPIENINRTVSQSRYFENCDGTTD